MEQTPEYHVPLKVDLPCFTYDVALYCKDLLDSVNVPFPAYLKNYHDSLHFYADHLEKLKPTIFPDGYRIYIIDCRLNVPFVMQVSNSEIALAIDDFAREERSIEDYHFGDGEYLSTKAIEPSEEEYHAFLNSCNQQFGFLPEDRLSMNSYVVYQDDTLIHFRMISPFQTALLMQKYSSSNLVDWDKITSNFIR